MNISYEVRVILTYTINLVIPAILGMKFSKFVFGHIIRKKEMNKDE